jgi:hypothetical protein
MTLPPYMSHDEVQRRLLLIFPVGEPRCLDAIATRVREGQSADAAVNGVLGEA